jgi:CheY-like chemotaxis protein
MLISLTVRLHQVLMNLLANAYKFTSKGTVTVRSVTEYEDEKSIRVTCSISDTGIGISQEQMSRLFTPFSQADSSTQRQFGGSGLGLSICKALIEVLDGRIWLESQLGVGSTVSFTLSFPRVSVQPISPNEHFTTANESDPMATWSSDATESSPKPPLSARTLILCQIPRDQIRICIAEDNPINQKIAISFVTKLGFQCQAFNDGAQAVEALRKQSKAGTPFHLVLMDVQMPVLDGYEATRVIREDLDPVVRGVLIIAMTASAIRGDREKCIEAGMNNYLAKPVRAAVLKEMLEEYLSQEPKSIPNLQESVAEVARSAVAREKAATEKRRKISSVDGTKRTPSGRKKGSSSGVSRTSSKENTNANSNSNSTGLLNAREMHGTPTPKGDGAMTPRRSSDDSTPTP